MGEETGQKPLVDAGKPPTKKQKQTKNPTNRCSHSNQKGGEGKGGERRGKGKGKRRMREPRRVREPELPPSS
ncbi:hypothetical protein CJ030_MR4G011985 [Morella rubra]|uniref:Uncharacterized protein n=1 Tax=Morella rubra TaxID=262757 RepID=A0A6A1VX82_9ROSI|nr:hypothetical protein CJ030_MR4G011985 [Morella rubra]